MGQFWAAFFVRQGKRGGGTRKQHSPEDRIVGRSDGIVVERRNGGNLV